MKRIISLILLILIFSYGFSSPQDFQFNKATVVNDFKLAVGMGLVEGFSILEKFGENPDIDSGSGYEYIWDGGGTYVAPTQARLHNIASTLAADAGTVLSSGTATGGSTTTLIDTSATFTSDGVVAGETLLNDTNGDLGTIIIVTETTLTLRMFMPTSGRPGVANNSGDSYRVVTNASTGASIFWVFGLDANFLEQDEFIVLNGVNNVATVLLYIRQFRARVYGIGTTGATGTVTSTAQVDGTVTCQIINGNNQSMMAIYTIPINKTGYIFEWWGSLSKKVSAFSTMRLRVGTLGGISYLIQPRSITSTGSSNFFYYDKYHFIPGGTDVWIEGDSSANDVGVAAGFDIILVDN